MIYMISQISAIPSPCLALTLEAAANPFTAATEVLDMFIG